MEERWTREITIENRHFEVVFERRPFREGLEVSVNVGPETLKFAELGYGEENTLAVVKQRISDWLSHPENQ